MDPSDPQGFIEQPRQVSLRALRALFIDTGAFWAKEIAADQQHEQAGEFWNRIQVEEPVIYSFEHILDEIATLFLRRTSYPWSAEWGRDELGAGVHFLATEEGDLLEAFALMKKAQNSQRKSRGASVQRRKRHLSSTRKQLLATISPVFRVFS